MTPSGSATLSALAILLVCVVAVILGTRGTGSSRLTSDFYVARRAVSSRRNASAIAGEYLSGASFLGVAGFVHRGGSDMLWFPLGYTAGYVVLLMLVAAPLRRSGAYTLPDFAHGRLETSLVRPLASSLVIGMGLVYLVPLLQGAGDVLRHVTGAPPWVGPAVVGVIVLVNVASGGMSAITGVQAMQYWLKLATLAIPAVVLVGLWIHDGRPMVASEWAQPQVWEGTTSLPIYTTWSTFIGLALGTMGLPHVLVRFYTNPDGRSARQTTVNVVALLGVFYLIAPIYGALGHIYAGGQQTSSNVVLDLPMARLEGWPALVLSALLAGGAFAAFLATASGLVVSIAGVLDQDFFRGRLNRWTGFDTKPVQTFRVATVVAVVVPVAISLSLSNLPLLDTVNLAFGIASTTFGPLLILGIWWRRLSRVGAIGGLIFGASVGVLLGVLEAIQPPMPGWLEALVSAPALWSVPLSFATVMALSLLTPGSIPPHTRQILRQLHTPEPRAVPDLDVAGRPEAGRPEVASNEVAK